MEERIIEYTRAFTVAELLECLQRVPNPEETYVRVGRVLSTSGMCHGTSVRLVETTLTDRSTVVDVELAAS